MTKPLINGINYKETINLGINELGGPTSLSRLMTERGAGVTRQSIYQWMLKGYIPRTHRPTLYAIVNTYRGLMTEPEKFKASINIHLTPKLPTVFRNEALNKWIDKQGGPKKFLKTLNSIVEEGTGIRNKFKPIHLHNWMRRGRIPTQYRENFQFGLDCPLAVLDAPLIPDPFAQPKRKPGPKSIAQSVAEDQVRNPAKPYEEKQAPKAAPSVTPSTPPKTSSPITITHSGTPDLSEFDLLGE